MEKLRIVITGVGVVAPNGIGKEEFWANCRAGVSGIKPITLFDTSAYRWHHAGEISDFQPEKYLSSKGLRNLDRTTLLSLVAAKLAIEDAKLEITDENRNDIGVVLGSTMGSVHSISEFDKAGLRESPRYVNPSHFPNTVINSPASQVAIRFGLKGLNATIATGFTAGIDAVGYAMDMLRLGRAKKLLVGGVEELCVQTYLGFYKLGLLKKTQIGEGAVFIVLEPESLARHRGVDPLNLLLGYGTAFSVHRTGRFQPEPSGAVSAIREALRQAGLEAGEVNEVQRCVNGVRAFDEAESAALKLVFGKTARSPRMFEGSRLWGETFSANGALRLASALSPNQQVEDQEPNTTNVLIDGVSPLGASSALILARGETHAQKKLALATIHEAI